LIKHLRNSNRQFRQTTLSGLTLPEYKFHAIGFVPADVVRLRRDVWFIILSSEQVDLVEQFLAVCRYS